VEVWFNPSCSKCVMAKEALDEAGVDYTLRRYLDDPPTADELRDALDALGLEPWDITRMREPVAAELGLAQMPRERERWISILAEHPALIQRPIVMTEDGSAWVARDPETLSTVVEHGRSAPS
jgi:arsenate reductase (glutaredoxin)